MKIKKFNEKFVINNIIADYSFGFDELIDELKDNVNKLQNIAMEQMENDPNTEYDDDMINISIDLKKFLEESGLLNDKILDYFHDKRIDINK